MLLPWLPQRYQLYHPMGASLPSSLLPVWPIGPKGQLHLWLVLSPWFSWPLTSHLYKGVLVLLKTDISSWSFKGKPIKTFDPLHPCLSTFWIKLCDSKHITNDEVGYHGCPNGLKKLPAMVGHNLWCTIVHHALRLKLRVLMSIFCEVTAGPPITQVVFWLFNVIRSTITWRNLSSYQNPMFSW